MPDIRLKFYFAVVLSFQEWQENINTGYKNNGAMEPKNAISV